MSFPWSYTEVFWRGDLPTDPVSGNWTTPMFESEQRSDVRAWTHLPARMHLLAHLGAYGRLCWCALGGSVYAVM